jgi:hypothetical protein
MLQSWNPLVSWCFASRRAKTSVAATANALKSGSWLLVVGGRSASRRSVGSDGAANMRHAWIEAATTASTAAAT